MIALCILSILICLLVEWGTAEWVHITEEQILKLSRIKNLSITLQNLRFLCDMPLLISLFLGLQERRYLIFSLLVKEQEILGCTQESL